MAKNSAIQPTSMFQLLIYPHAFLIPHLKFYSQSGTFVKHEPSIPDGIPPIMIDTH